MLCISCGVSRTVDHEEDGCRGSHTQLLMHIGRRPASHVSCGEKAGITSENELNATEGRLALPHMPCNGVQALKQSGVHHRDLRTTAADTTDEPRVYVGLTPTDNSLCFRMNTLVWRKGHCSRSAASELCCLLILHLSMNFGSYLSYRLELSYDKHLVNDE